MKQKRSESGSWEPSPEPLFFSDQAFTQMLRGINRPTTIRFGPDGAAYLVDYAWVLKKIVQET